MKTLKKAWLLAPALVLALACTTPGYAQEHDKATAGQMTSKIVQTDNAMRDLWLGHVFWVRNVVVDTFAGNSDAAAAAEKEVVANAKAIAAAIEPFYGKAGADKLFELLAAHYGAVKQYLDATVAKSQPKQDAAMKALTDNAGQIAVFLSGANPNLPQDAVRGMLVAHGAHHVQQIHQLRDKQYTQEAQTWEAMKNHMYTLADTLTNAIAKQFPAKF